MRKCESGSRVLLQALSMIALLFPGSTVARAGQDHSLVLNPETYQHYFESFGHNDSSMGGNHVDSASVWPWMVDNIPFFDCPDRNMEEVYYFRWWAYRKHIREAHGNFVITEFLPDVSWAGKYNTISCAAGHHFYEGRWLRNRQYLDDYSEFWFRRGGDPRLYSFWAADAIYANYLVHRDTAPLRGLLPNLVKNYQEWETSHQDSNGLFWQIDDRDGMEKSIGGSGYRATINSYMYGDALAIAKIARLAGKPDLAGEYEAKAARIKKLVETKLWDKEAEFFKVLPRGESERLADVRELHGYVPWYFNLPGPQFASAWKQLMDPRGFFAPFGPTTAEQRHPRFMFSDPHECLWNGPSWPFATTQTLVALANLLNGEFQPYIGKKDYFSLLGIYTRTQHRKLPDGRVIPWIDENADPFTGEWLARSLLYKENRADKDRGKDYNHSGYADMIITGLAGLRPRPDDTLEVNPLLPKGAWDYFCLDNVSYHDRRLTILYDKDGRRYQKGHGLRVLVDGVEVAAASELRKVTGQLPSARSSALETSLAQQTSGGWQKRSTTPVLGGKLGTCFDVALLKEGTTYRMWFSWRPKKSIALVESADGVNWSEPVIVLGPNPETSWESDINRPVVVKRGDGFHLWYTGQASGHSWIGYAKSSDGRHWIRVSREPVLSPELPWEKVAVMCPHVIWDDQARMFRMWYSGGEQYEPDAIGYATSPDGLHWSKLPANPVFRASPDLAWESHKVTACQVVQHGGWHVMFYIGFRDVDHAQIGVARSRDGISHWERHPANPIIRPGKDMWDQDACYKPFAIFSDGRWLLWYNGRRGNEEQIGLAVHPGEELGF